MCYNYAMNNPYPYTEDNKRYQTWNYYTKANYGTRLFKVPLEAGFTCPNRDGSVGYGGCSFCAGGSNSFPQLSGSDLYSQYLVRKEIFLHKWPTGRPLAYFQSYSNTYASIDKLKQLYQPFLDDEEIVGLVIATRCDCLSKEIIEYLNELTLSKATKIRSFYKSMRNKKMAGAIKRHHMVIFQSASLETPLLHHG